MGMTIVPWTVNSLEKIQELKALGVDGVITDYPNLLAEPLKK
jgi:glycerophosphoryl diester phosphodiesterase